MPLITKDEWNQDTDHRSKICNKYTHYFQCLLAFQKGIMNYLSSWLHLKHRTLLQIKIGIILMDESICERHTSNAHEQDWVIL